LLLEQEGGPNVQHGTRHSRMRQPAGVALCGSLTSPPPSCCGKAAASARAEVIDRMLIFSGRHLRLVLAEYKARCNGRRPHRSRQLCPPRPDYPVADLPHKRIKRRPVLGGSSTNAGEPPRSPGQDR
jgi:hypothetical protein